MSIRIEYGGVAVGAKQDFLASAPAKESFVDLRDLNKTGAQIKNYGNPCEPYTVPLDGGTIPLPSEHNGDNIGWWSNQTSNNSGTFDPPLVLTLTATDYYTSNGITVVFDTFNNIYPTYMKAEWYRDNELLSETEYYPDKPRYFCANRVESYNKVIFSIQEINMPNTRLRLRDIEYGANMIFTGADLKNAKMLQQISPISLELPINTLDVDIYGKQANNLAFEEKQPMSVYFNEKLQGTMFVQSAKQSAPNQWRITAEDYLGVLEDTPFSGGIYKYKLAFDIIEEIFTVAKVPYLIDEEMQEYWVSGYIPYTNCRAALMQVLFAIGAVADTSASAVVKIFEIGTESSQSIPLTRIMQGQTVSNDTRITAVELTAHEYIQTQEIVTAYTGGTENGMFITFSEPLYDLTIINGEILNSGTNFATINASDNCVLQGKRYAHTTITKRKQNPSALATDIEKVVSVKNATLISTNNLDKILDLCYNYYSKTRKVAVKIAERTGKDASTSVGNILTVDTPLGSSIKGVIESQSFKLVGGLLIKDTIIREVI